MDKFYVYFFYDKKGILLYVGKTISISSRMSAHFSKTAMKDEFWKKDVDLSNIAIHKCNTKTDLDIYETYFINKLKPLYNVDKVFHSLPTFELPELDSTLYSYNPNPPSKKLNLAFLDYIKLRDKEIKSKEDFTSNSSETRSEIAKYEFQFPIFIKDYDSEVKEEVLADKEILESLNKLPELSRKIFAEKMDLGKSYIKFDRNTNTFIYRV